MFQQIKTHPVRFASKPESVASRAERAAKLVTAFWRQRELTETQLWLPRNLIGAEYKNIPAGQTCSVAIYVTVPRKDDPQVYFTLVGNPYVPPLQYLALDDFLEEHNGGDATVKVQIYLNAITCHCNFTPLPGVEWTQGDVVSKFKDAVVTLAHLTPHWIFRRIEMNVFNAPRTVTFTCVPLVEVPSVRDIKFTPTISAAALTSAQDACQYFKVQKLFGLYYFKTGKIAFSKGTKEGTYEVVVRGKPIVGGMKMLPAEDWMKLLANTYQLRHAYASTTDRYYSVVYRRDDEEDTEYTAPNQPAGYINTGGTMYF